MYTYEENKAYFAGKHVKPQLGSADRSNALGSEGEESGPEVLEALRKELQRLQGDSEDIHGLEGIRNIKSLKERIDDLLDDALLQSIANAEQQPGITKKKISESLGVRPQNFEKQYERRIDQKFPYRFRRPLSEDGKKALKKSVKDLKEKSRHNNVLNYSQPIEYTAKEWRSFEQGLLLRRTFLPQIDKYEERLRHGVPGAECLKPLQNLTNYGLINKKNGQTSKNQE